MFESSKFDKSGLKSYGHIRLGRIWKKGSIPAGAGYDIRCKPTIYAYFDLESKAAESGLEWGAAKPQGGWDGILPAGPGAEPR